MQVNLGVHFKIYNIELSISKNGEYFLLHENSHTNPKEYCLNGDKPAQEIKFPKKIKIDKNGNNILNEFSIKVLNGPHNTRILDIKKI